MFYRTDAKQSLRLFSFAKHKFWFWLEMYNFIGFLLFTVYKIHFDNNIALLVYFSLIEKCN